MIDIYTAPVTPDLSDAMKAAAEGMENLNKLGCACEKTHDDLEGILFASDSLEEEGTVRAAKEFGRFEDIEEALKKGPSPDFFAALAQAAKKLNINPAALEKFWNSGDDAKQKVLNKIQATMDQPLAKAASEDMSFMSDKASSDINSAYSAAQIKVSKGDKK